MLIRNFGVSTASNPVDRRLPTRDDCIEEKIREEFLSPEESSIWSRVIVPSLSTWLTGIIGQGGASGGARSSDVKLIGKSVTRPRRSSSRFGKREDPVILEDEEGGEVTTRMMK